MTVSWKIVFAVPNPWQNETLRFATQAEAINIANKWVKQMHGRWNGAFNIVETTDPVNAIHEKRKIGMHEHSSLKRLKNG